MIFTGKTAMNTVKRQCKMGKQKIFAQHIREKEKFFIYTIFFRPIRKKPNNTVERMTNFYKYAKKEIQIALMHVKRNLVSLRIRVM